MNIKTCFIFAENDSALNWTWKCQLHWKTQLHERMHIIRYLEGVLAPSSHCSILIETPWPWSWLGKWSQHSSDGFDQGILKWEVSLYCWPPVWLGWSLLYDNWQFLFLFAKQTNPNQSNRRSMVQWHFPGLVFPGLTNSQFGQPGLFQNFDRNFRIFSVPILKYWKIEKKTAKSPRRRNLFFPQLATSGHCSKTFLVRNLWILVQS